MQILLDILDMEYNIFYKMSNILDMDMFIKA
jgi:hypothetical protein